MHNNYATHTNIARKHFLTKNDTATKVARYIHYTPMGYKKIYLVQNIVTA